MAESIVSYFTQKLDTLITEEGNLLHGVEEQLSLLQREFEFIKSFLRDAEMKRRKSHLVEIWVAQIRDIAYDAEDVIDAYILHLEQQNAISMLNKIFYSCKKFKTLHKIGEQIKQINTRARRISTCKSDYQIDVSETTQDLDLDAASIRRGGIPTAEEIDVVGFQKESMRIVNLLREESLPCQVISIIGMGGLGKTTLAQKMYKSYDVIDWFDVRVWITVSQEYQVRDILLSALKQVSGCNNSSMELMENEELKIELCKKLINKKYLVIIDDIWKVEAWDQICGSFPNKEKTSRVILTTRNKEVALHADSSGGNHIELCLLNDSESWELFCKKVFQLPVAACPPELVKLGKEIVEKCGGLPLAILVIGGILVGKGRTIDAWSKVAESASWHLSQDSNQCRQILTMSYSDLPYYLKPCFLYIGLFPEDLDIDARKLIRLWVAEGFVEGRGQINMEDVAEDYVEDLVHRSLIQVRKRVCHGGSVENFRVHDLLRDLAIAEGKKDRFIEIHNSNSPLASTAKPRRIALHSGSTGQEKFCTVTPPNLRSLLIFQKDHAMPTFSDGIKMLRVLDLKGLTINKGFIPKEIGNLVFLHYLGISGYTVHSLSSYIGNLAKLQTLDINLTGITVLPKSIWKLKNLRHLLLPFSLYKVDCIVGIKDFGRNLLTLDVRSQFWMNKDGIGLSNVLLKQGCLRSLLVSDELALKNDMMNLKNHFPSTLTELRLHWTCIEGDPSDVLGSLPTLKILSLGLNSYKGREMVFRSGRYPQLQYLHIAALHNLSEWKVEDGSISVLRHLKLSDLEKLEKLPTGLKNVITLQKIVIIDMPHFEGRIQENGQDWDIVKHIPYRHYLPDEYSTMN